MKSEVIKRSRVYNEVKIRYNELRTRLEVRSHN